MITSSARTTPSGPCRWRCYNHYKRVNTAVDMEGVETPEVQHSSWSDQPVRARPCWPRPWPEILNVPFTIADATALTEAGYVGEDVENIIQSLLQAADYDVERASMGHRLHRRDRQDRPQDRQSVHHPGRLRRGASSRPCLRLVEGTTASVPPKGGRKHPQQEFVKVDTTNILFICGGAFVRPGANHPCAGPDLQDSLGFGSARSSPGQG